jgi:hypothetical protein
MSAGDPVDLEAFLASVDKVNAAISGMAVGDAGATARADELLAELAGDGGVVKSSRTVIQRDAPCVIGFFHAFPPALSVPTSLSSPSAGCSPADDAVGFLRSLEQDAAEVRSWSYPAPATRLF